MVRDTKMLTIGLHNLNEGRTEIAAEDFEVYIKDDNTVLAYNNDVVSDVPVIYRPFHEWDTQSTDGYGTLTDKTAHFCLTFNRLIWHGKTDQNARLYINNKKTGEQVAEIDLTDFLAQGRNAIDTYRYSSQEFLDRGYDFYMDFFLQNGKWQEVHMSLNIGVNILSWARRYQDENLGETIK